MSDTAYVTFSIREKDKEHPAVERFVHEYADEHYFDDGMLTVCCYELNYAGAEQASELFAAGIPFVRHNERGDDYGEGLLVYLGHGEPLACATLDGEPVTAIRVLKGGTILLPSLAEGLKAHAARQEFFHMCKEDSNGNHQG